MVENLGPEINQVSNTGTTTIIILKTEKIPSEKKGKRSIWESGKEGATVPTRT